MWVYIRVLNLQPKAASRVLVDFGCSFLPLLLAVASDICNPSSFLWLLRVRSATSLGRRSYSNFCMFYLCAATDCCDQLGRICQS
ncbi:hypothetical protein ACOSP7_023940 [Xanthoceras sorbifolium]